MLSTSRVLLVGVDEPVARALVELLAPIGHAVSSASDVGDAARRVGAGEVDVAVLGHAALEDFDRLTGASTGGTTRFVALAATMSSAQAGRMLHAGITDVVDPSCGEAALLAAIERATREAQLRRELAMLRARVGDSAQGALIGRSPTMERVRELLGRAAASCAPVLVTGERGVGKGVVARLVHDLSERAARPMISIRCAGADASALEQELFGYAGGEGTRARAGLLEEASGGTIVLEDASALPAALRVRLASAAFSRTVRRVGGDQAIPIGARLVLVARAQAREAVGESIEDLLRRFNAILIEVPPLRERRRDIPQLVQHFRKVVAASHGLELAPLSPDEMLRLLGREWPGNVEELEEWVERHALEAGPVPKRATPIALPVDLGPSHATLEQVERAYILHVLALEAGHQSRTASRLGIDRRTLYRKLRQHRGE